MHFKSILVALAVFGAVQAAPEFPSRRDVLDDALEAFKKYFLETTQKLNELDEKITQTLDAMEKKVTETAEKEAKNLHDKLAEAAAEAAKQGVDVTECLSEESKIDVIFQNFVKDSRKCMSNEKKTLTDFTEQFQKHLESSYKVLVDASEAKKECDKLATIPALKCKAAAAARYSKEFGQLTVDGTLLVTKAQKAMAVAYAKIDYCITNASLSYGQEATKVALDSLQCMEDKIKSEGTPQGF